MDSTPAKLLLTRPLPMSQAFLTDCEARIGHRLDAEISPLLRIEPVGELPDLDEFDTVIATSGHAVQRLGERLQDRRVATVGRKTAALAANLGAMATALGEDVETFLASRPNLGRAIFCRGVHSRGNLADRLIAQGNLVTEAVIYDQVSQPLSASAKRLLTETRPVIAPVFSPRTAALLSVYPITAPLSVIVISPATAEAWTGPGDVRVAAQPDADHMCRRVVEAF